MNRHTIRILEGCDKIDMSMGPTRVLEEMNHTINMWDWPIRMAEEMSHKFNMSMGQTRMAEEMSHTINMPEGPTRMSGNMSHKFKMSMGQPGYQSKWPTRMLAEMAHTINMSEGAHLFIIKHDNKVSITYYTYSSFLAHNIILIYTTMNFFFFFFSHINKWVETWWSWII